MLVNASVSGECAEIIKARQDLKEALIPIPILKKDAEYSSETSVSITLIVVLPCILISTRLFRQQMHFYIKT